MIALVALAMSASPRAEEPARHVVMISIDGLRPSFYTQPGPAKIPTIRRLMQQGAWARGVTGVLPSVTYPSHTTLITGVLPARHGIFDNRILDPEGTSNMAWFWYARDIRVTTLPAAVRARGLTAAAVNWPVTVGMDLDHNMPEIARSRHPRTWS
jgi:predicted AlkP superfamily pyrophosphatase or phosphodiesterase